MSLMASFFAPRTDHRGWSTPSEAARLFFLVATIAVALWASIFYSIGYSFYKILAVLLIGIPITPLVWQFMSIYKEKNARDKQLSQWEEIK